MNALVSTAAVATAVPTTIAQSGISDPVLAAIERLRRVAGTIDALALDVDVPDDLGQEHIAAKSALVRTVPTTPAGLAALTEWLRETGNECAGHSTFLNSEDQAAVYRSIDTAVRGMSGLAPRQVMQTNEPDPIYHVLDQFRMAWAKMDAECSALDQADTPEAHERLDQLNYAINRAEDALVEVVPTTLAGLQFMFEYLADFEGKGHLLITRFEDSDDPKITTMHKEAMMPYFIHRNAARALARLAA